MGKRVDYGRRIGDKEDEASRKEADGAVLLGRDFA